MNYKTVFFFCSLIHCNLSVIKLNLIGQDLVVVNQKEENMKKDKLKWKVLFGGFGCYMFDSIDLVLLSLSLAMIIKDFGLSMERAGLLGTFTLIGVGLSSIFAGWVADNYGRRKTLFWCMISFGILTGAIAFSQNWYQILALRFFSGLGLGGVAGVIFAYVNESWPKEQRGRATAFTISSFNVGAGLAAFVASYILPHYGWRGLFPIGVLAVIPAIYMYIFVPESKEWEEQKAARMKQSSKTAKVSVSEIFKGGYAKNTILATLVSAFAFSANWGVSTWLPTFLVKERGLTPGKMALFITIAYIGAFIGQNVVGFIADKIGKKYTLIITFIACIIVLPIYVLTHNKTGLMLIGPVYSFFLTYTGLFGSYFSELFPTRIRATGSGFCFNFGRGISSIAPFILGTIAAKYSLSFGMLICAGFYVVCLITMFFLPNFKKDVQPNIQQEFINEN